MQQAVQDQNTRRLLGVPEVTKVPAGGADSHFELHFIGELDFGTRFPGISADDGLFVDYAAHAGTEWHPMVKEGYIGQTQTAYADCDGMHVFNHPIDFHYFAFSIDGWPLLHMEVLKLDVAGQVETVSYGSVALPSTPGHAELVCRTWSPLAGSPLDESRASHLGGPLGALPAGAGRTEILAARSPEARAQMVTRTSGSVRLSIDTIFRNAAKHGILVPQHGH